MSTVKYTLSNVKQPNQARRPKGLKMVERLEDDSPVVPKLASERVATALSAKEVFKAEGLDLWAVRELLSGMMSSTGGRPTLAGVRAQAKIPKIEDDWEKLKILSGTLNVGDYKVTPGQLAAVLIHKGLLSATKQELQRDAHDLLSAEHN